MKRVSPLWKASITRAASVRSSGTGARLAKYLIDLRRSRVVGTFMTPIILYSGNAGWVVTICQRMGNCSAEMLAQDRDFVAADPSGLSPQGEAFRSAPLSAGLKPCSYAGKALGPRVSTEQFVYPLADGPGSQSERGHIWALRSASRYLLLHQGGDDSQAAGP